MDTILILDFGGQSTQLIGRRVRQLGVYSDIVRGDANLDSLTLTDVRGIILSGSPYSVYEPGSPSVDQRIYGLGLPILGICYGLQRLTVDHGGKVEALGRKEYGRARLTLGERNGLFARVPVDSFVSWMSHGDSLTEVPQGFRVIAQSENGIPAAFVNEKRRLWGVQFHPEVSHCEYGMEVLDAFVSDICGARKEWNMTTFFSQQREKLAATVGKKPVVLLISGGVDSCVVAALLLKSLDASRVHLMYIDTGLMRKGESEEVLASLGTLGAEHVHAVDASKRFYAVLAGLTDPEQKRRAIGDMFMKVQETEIDALGVRDYFLAQGTLYTDLIESGRGVG